MIASIALTPYFYPPPPLVLPQHRRVDRQGQELDTLRQSLVQDRSDDLRRKSGQNARRDQYDLSLSGLSTVRNLAPWRFRCALGHFAHALAGGLNQLREQVRFR